VESDLVSIDLPENTVAVLFRPGVGVFDIRDSQRYDDAAGRVPNLVTVQAVPGTAEVRFLRYEVVQNENDDDFFEIPLELTESTIVVPDAEERVLFEEVGGTFYFAFTRSSDAWKFPLPSEALGEVATDEVFRATFRNPGVDLPSGMILVPGDPDHAWFSLKNESELNLIPFDEEI